MGIIAVNAAAIKPLFSAKRWLSSSKGNSAPKDSHGGNNSHPLATIGSSNLNSHHHTRHARSMNYTDIDNSSEEHIFKPDLSHLRGETKVSANSGTGKKSAGGYPGAITVTTQVHVDDNQKSRLDV